MSVDHADIPDFLRRTARDLENEATEHRTGESDPKGKKNVSNEFLTTQAMRADMQAIATIEKISMGEYIRKCVARDLYGRLELIRRSVPKDV